MRFPIAAAAICAAALAVPAFGQALPPGSLVARDRVVLRLRPAVAHAAYAQSVARAGSTSLRESPSTLAALQVRLGATRLAPEFPGEAEPAGAGADFTTFWIAHVDPHRGPAATLEAARRDPDVVEASPVILVPVDAVTAPAEPAQLGATRNTLAAVPPPNDSLWSLCWWLQQPSRRDLHALEAWEITRGDPSTVIAIIDTGVLWWHPDLGGVAPGDDGQIWINAAEAAGAPGVDDDGNGYVDDVRGWDFIALASDTDPVVRAGEDWRDEDPDPTDFAVHGTAVAGVAAAKADNGAGAAGVAPGVRIMPLRAGFSALINPAGIMDLSAVARAIRYAVRNGASVINCSFSTSGTPDLRAAAEDALAAGVLLVVAAGNNGTTNYLGSLDQTIAVTATDASDRLPAFANRGQWVDVAAPGQSIATTTLRATGPDSVALRTPFYSPSEAGTSFSSPMVAAGLALVQSNRKAHGLPPLSPWSALLRLDDTADDIASLNPSGGFGAGRLNLLRLLTDPERSRAVPAGARTVGPCAIVNGPAGDTLVVFASADGVLRFERSSTSVPVTSVALGAAPRGGVSAAPLGPGLGTGLFVVLADGRIAGFDVSGAPLPGWPVTGSAAGGGETMVALGDLDGDGFTDVVWGGGDGRVRAWRRDGLPLPGFPYFVGSHPAIALAPLDDCPGEEVVVSTEAGLAVVLGAGATPLAGWPKLLGHPPLVPPIVAKLDPSGTPVLVFAGGQTIETFYPCSRRGSAIVPLTGISGELAAGDLDGDGLDELVGLTGNGAVLFVMSAGRSTAEYTLGIAGGPPLIGPLAPGGAPDVVLGATNLADRALVFAFDGALQPLAGWPKRGDVTPDATLADLDGDGHTEVAAGVGGDLQEFVYDAGPGTWNAAAAIWPTPRGDFARRRSRYPTTETVVDLPVAVADLRARTLAPRAFSVEWTTPRSSGSFPGVAEYDVRVASAPLDEADFPAAIRVLTGAPRPPGTIDSLAFGALREGGQYWVAMRNSDFCGRWSPLSNVLAITLPAVPPAAVHDLAVEATTDSTVSLVWTATGDDGLQGRPGLYRIRASEGVLDSAGFAAATLGGNAAAEVEPGYYEHFTLGGLPRDTTLSIALRAVDPSGFASGISNVVQVRLGMRHGSLGRLALAIASPSRLPVTLRWQNAPRIGGPGDALAIYDATGRRLARFRVDSVSGAAVWNGSGGTGRVPPGVYFAELASGGTRMRSRFVLLR